MKDVKNFSDKIIFVGGDIVDHIKNIPTNINDGSLESKVLVVEDNVSMEPKQITDIFKDQRHNITVSYIGITHPNVSISKFIMIDNNGKKKHFTIVNVKEIIPRGMFDSDNFIKTVGNTDSTFIYIITKKQASDEYSNIVGLLEDLDGLLTNPNDNFLVVNKWLYPLLVSITKETTTGSILTPLQTSLIPIDQLGVVTFNQLIVKAIPIDELNIMNEVLKLNKKQRLVRKL